MPPLEAKNAREAEKVAAAEAAGQGARREGCRRGSRRQGRIGRSRHQHFTRPGCERAGLLLVRSTEPGGARRDCLGPDFALMSRGPAESPSEADIMPSYICTTCGVGYAETEAPRDTCPICADERQYVNPAGRAGRRSRRCTPSTSTSCAQPEPGLLGIGTTPQIAIGQRALLIERPDGGVMWDCTPLITEAAVAAIKAQGRRAGHGDLAPAFLRDHGRLEPGAGRRADLPARGQPRLGDAAGPGDPFWTGDSKTLTDGVTLVRSGGHFPGSTRAALGRRRRRQGRAVHRRHHHGGARHALGELHVLLPQPDPAQRTGGGADRQGGASLRVRPHLCGLVGPGAATTTPRPRCSAAPSGISQRS